MSDFTFWDILRNLLTGLQWTLALSLVAFIGGGLVGLLILVMRISKNTLPSSIARTWIELFQGTPLLMQLFLVFFGVALAGIEISPWMAAAIALTLFTSAYLAEIWRGCVESISNGQWEASASLALVNNVRAIAAASQGEISTPSRAMPKNTRNSCINRGVPWNSSM